MPVVITAASLRTIAPGAATAIVEGIVAHQALLAKYGINDGPKAALRVAHFLGQSATETQGFTRLEENLHYTSTARLRAVWPSRFKTAAAAAPYVRNPEKLANLVYGGRLGNAAPRDGWKYRGSGCKQTTGKYNFGQVEKATGLPVVAHPDMLRRFPEALESACIYWRDNKLVRYADADDIVGLTRAIQGGSGGLADRRIYTDRAKRVKWATSSDPLPTSPLQGEEKGGAAAAPVLRNGDGIVRNLALRPLIIEAQKRLVVHGHYAGGAIDGKFGDGTENAVADFQRAHGLMADGVIGPATWPALRADPRVTAAAAGRSDAGGGESIGGVVAVAGSGVAAASAGAVAAVADDNGASLGAQIVLGGLVLAAALAVFLVIRKRRARAAKAKGA